VTGKIRADSKPEGIHAVPTELGWKFSPRLAVWFH
jgi:hypothetical protein